MTHRILKDRTAHGVVLTTTVTWRHALGRDAVCLARLFAAPTATAIVLSEIADNPDALGITADFPAAATTAWSVLAQHHDGLSAAATAWYAHHGPFSSHDPGGPETLTEVALSFDGSRFAGSLQGQHLLDAPETRRLLDLWGLEPVNEALGRLGQA